MFKTNRLLLLYYTKKKFYYIDGKYLVELIKLSLKFELMRADRSEALNF